MYSVHDLVGAPGALRAKEQCIAWNLERWENRLGPAWMPVLRELHEACVADGGGLRRSAVTAFGREDASRLLVAAMAWGFGSVGYGPWRTARMLETDGAADILADIVDTVRRQGAAAGYCQLWDGNRGRLRGLGVVFGTKLLYFAGLECALSPRPLIYDTNVFKRLRSLHLGLPWAVPFAGIYAEQYDQYCRWAQEIAEECEVEPDDVECALFGSVAGPTAHKGGLLRSLSPAAK